MCKDIYFNNLNNKKNRNNIPFFSEGEQINCGFICLMGYFTTVKMNELVVYCQHISQKQYCMTMQISQG